QENAAPRPSEAAFVIGKRREVDTEYTNPTGIRLVKAEYGPQQNGLARTRPADNAYHLAAPDREVEIFMDDMIAKARVDPFHFDDRFALLRHAHTPTAVKNMANSASRMMTRKIDRTTERVVMAPTDSALPVTERPARHPTSAMIDAMKGALMRPTAMVQKSTASCTRAR